MNTRIWLALCAGLLLAACGGGKPNPGGSGTVSGFVTDIGSGAKLAGVSVEGVGTAAKTTTDASGQFSLGGLAEGTVKLSFHKDGYAPGYATARTGAQEASTLVALKKEGNAQPYDPATGQTLYQMTEAGPYAVIFAAGSLATADANLRVVITPLDPTKEGQALPGQLRAGSNPLIPVTFAEFSILDSAGASTSSPAPRPSSSCRSRLSSAGPTPSAPRSIATLTTPRPGSGRTSSRARSSSRASTAAPRCCGRASATSPGTAGRPRGRSAATGRFRSSMPAAGPSREPPSW